MADSGCQRRAALQLDLSAAACVGNTRFPDTLAIDDAGQVTNDRSPSAVGARADDIVVFPGLTNSHDHLDFSLYPTLGDPPYRDVDEWARDVHRNCTAEVAAQERIPRELRRYWGMLKNLSNGVTTVMDHHAAKSGAGFDAPLRVISRFRYLHRADTRWAELRALLARGNGPLVFHVGEGNSDTVDSRSSRFLRRIRAAEGLIGVHGISLTAADAAHLRALVWCPVSNLFLFGRTADVSLLKECCPILFGTDSGISASGTIWDHLRVAREVGGLNDRELFDSLTTRAARAWNVDSSGDLVIARRRHDDPLRSFLATTTADIQAVIVAGRLALLSESFYDRHAPDAWGPLYRGIEINGVKQRVRTGRGMPLERLAALANAPLSLW